MPKPDVHDPKHSSSAAGYEKRDVSVKWIVSLGGFLLVGGLIAHFVVAKVMKHFEKTPAPQDRWIGAKRTPSGTAESPGAPRLQLSPIADLKAFRAREEAALTSYGWVNRTAGIVRIPIDRAMELVLQKGLPARTETNAVQIGPSNYELQFKRPGYNQPEVQEPK